MGILKPCIIWLKQKVCYRGHSELTLTHKNQEKLDPFCHFIYTSEDVIKGPTRWQISNKIYEPSGEVLGWIIN